jgi:pimeloyl-ACP methyl ester carboxylesterase
VIDLPGFGDSEAVATDGPQSLLVLFARVAFAAVDEAGWSAPFFVVGHSHGSAVAQAMAGMHPGRIRGVVLVASLGPKAHPSYRVLEWPGMRSLFAAAAKALRVRWLGHVSRGILRGILAPMFAPEPLPQSCLEDYFAAFERRPDVLVTMVRLARDRPSDQLARGARLIHSPVLFVHGHDDRVVPRNYPALVQAMLPATTAATFETIDDAGHMLHWTHASEVARRMAAWLRR